MINETKKVRKKFKRQLNQYQKKMDEWRNRTIKSGSKTEINFCKFLNKILHFELPVEIMPTFPEFGLWVALKLEAQELYAACR